MAKSFRVRQISYQWISIILVLALAIVWLCLDSKNYWGLLGLVAPLGLTLDQLLSIYGRGALSRHIKIDLPQKGVEEPANRVAPHQGACHPRPERPEGFHRLPEGGEPDDGIRRRIK